MNRGSGKLPMMCCSIMTFAPSLQQWSQNNVSLILLNLSILRAKVQKLDVFLILKTV